MKKIVSLFLTLIIAMSLFSSVSVSVNGTSGLNLQQLKEKFPQGAYWNHKANNTHEYSGMDDYGTCNNPDGYTWTPCYSHSAVATAGYYDCNSFRGAMQCCGFAKKIAFDVYGSCHDSWGTTDITNCKSGDVVHYYSSQTDQTWGHWLMIIDRNGNIVTVGECNGTANANCQINWTRTMSISDFGWNKTCYSAPYELPKNCTSHKWGGGKVTKQPTCKKDGVKTYTCTVCGEKKTETFKHSSKYHNYKVSKCIKATLHTNGKLLKKCKHCGKTVKSTIYHPKTIKLKKIKFVYNGKTKKPEAVVKNTKGKTISSKYYKLTYSYNKNVGKATAKIKFKTRYSGSVKRYFVIKPKGTSITTLSAGVKAFTAKWKKKTTQTTGYQLQYATNSNFTKGKKTVTIKGAKTVSKKINKLKAGKKYYVRVRTYKKVKGVLYPSVWSKSLTVKTKKAADAKSVLLKKIKTNLEITKVFYSDYDGDGKKELFAVCGDIGNDISSFGEREIWFVSTKQTKCDNLSTMIYSAKCVKVNSKQKMFIAETGAGGSGSSSIWYYVKASKRKGNTFPFSGLTQIKKNQFKVTLHDFDNYVSDTGKPMGGHTYRQYYFKWTGTKFLEYKGTLISQKQLKKYKNGASIINKIKKLGYSIDTIYKRKNGVININVHIATNYEHELRYENVNLKLSNNKVSVIVTYKGGKDIVGKSSFGGIYKANLVFY